MPLPCTSPGCHVHTPPRPLPKAPTVPPVVALGVNHAISEKPSPTFLAHGLVYSLSLPDTFSSLGHFPNFPRGTPFRPHGQCPESQNLGCLRITKEHAGNTGSMARVLDGGLESEFPLVFYFHVNSPGCCFEKEHCKSPISVC